MSARIDLKASAPQRALPRGSGAMPLLLRAIWLWLQGRAYLRPRTKRVQIDDRGERFVAFRTLVVDPGPDRPEEPGAMFKVRFAFKNLPAAANRALSLIPVPLIAAQPGFRSKTWLLGERSGDLIGLYEFDSMEAAEAYQDSLPLRMMRRRAAPGSLREEILALA